jgi:hypothetical protein
MVAGIECENSNLGMWKTTYNSIRNIVIPFARDGTTPTHVITN